MGAVREGSQGGSTGSGPASEGSTCFGREEGRERSLRAKAQEGNRPDSREVLLLLNSETRVGGQLGAGAGHREPRVRPSSWSWSSAFLLPPSSDDLHSEQLSWAIINSELHPLGLGKLFTDQAGK